MTSTATAAGAMVLTVSEFYLKFLIDLATEKKKNWLFYLDEGLEYRSNKPVALYNLNASSIYMLYILQTYIVFIHTYVKS